MAQIIVRNIPEEVKASLARRARLAGRSMEEEVRRILKNAAQKIVQEEKTRANGKKKNWRAGLGTRIANRFRGIGFEGPIPEIRDKIGPVRFK